MLRQTDMLSREECRRVAEGVFALREYWVRRHETAPFYTLGAASYLDGDTQPSEKRRQYYEKAARYNPVLVERFGWLYERLTEVLARELGCPCAYEPRLARPGFHIFLPDKVFAEPVYSVHFDLQYLQVDWSGHSDPDFEHPLSFTVSIVLPRSGGGLHTWELYLRDWRGRSCAELMEAARAMKPSFTPYRLGALAMHDGHMVHQIAPMREVEAGNPDDARITLQGHALKSAGIWWLYW